MMRFGRSQRETSVLGEGESAAPPDHARQRAQSEVIGNKSSGAEGGGKRSLGLFNNGGNNGGGGGGRLSSRNLMGGLGGGGKNKDEADAEGTRTESESSGGKKEKTVLKRYKSDQAALRGASSAATGRGVSRVKGSEEDDGKKSKTGSSSSKRPGIRKTLSATNFGSSRKLETAKAEAAVEPTTTKIPTATKKEDDCYKPVERVNWGMGHYYHGNSQDWRVSAGAGKTDKQKAAEATTVNADKKADWNHLGPKEEREKDDSASSSSSSSSDGDDDSKKNKESKAKKKEKKDAKKSKETSSSKEKETSSSKEKEKESSKEKETSSSKEPKKAPTPKISSRKTKESSSSKAEEVSAPVVEKQKDEPKEESPKKEETKELTKEELKEQMKEKMREEMKEKMREEMARKELEEQAKKELEEELKRELEEELRQEKAKKEANHNSQQAAQPELDGSFSQLPRNHDAFADFGAAEIAAPAAPAEAQTPAAPEETKSSKHKTSSRRRASISNTPSFDENSAEIKKVSSHDKGADEGMLGVLNNAAATKAKQISADSVGSPDNVATVKKQKRRSSLSDASQLPPPSPTPVEPASPSRRIGKGFLGRAFKTDDPTEREATVDIDEIDEVPANTPGHDLFAYFLMEQEPVVYVQLSDESEDKKKKKKGDESSPVIIEYPELNIHLAARNTELALKPKQLQQEPYRPVGPLRDSLTSGLVQVF